MHKNAYLINLLQLFEGVYSVFSTLSILCQEEKRQQNNERSHNLNLKREYKNSFREGRKKKAENKPVHF